jgi:hypothetical protein
MNLIGGGCYLQLWNKEIAGLFVFSNQFKGIVLKDKQVVQIEGLRPYVPATGEVVMEQLLFKLFGNFLTFNEDRDKNQKNKGKMSHICVQLLAMGKSNILRRNRSFFYNNMVKKLWFILFLSFAGICISGCENEIEVFGEYKEMAVVYGFLDMGEPIQRLRIGRTFLNPGVPASQIAKIPDSIYFAEAEVTVINEQTGQRFTFTPDTSIPKDSGYFAHQPSIVYSGVMNIIPNNTYRLEVLNKQTGFVARSKTLIVGPPPTISFPVSVVNPNLSVAPDLIIQLRFVNGNNAKLHDAVFEFTIEEFSKSDTTQKRERFYAWRFVNNLRNENTAPGSRVRTTEGKNFFEYFKAVLPYDTTVYRRFKKIDFVLYSSASELADFMESTTPSIGIVQKQTEYTNIENGVGVFSSRHTARIKNITLDIATIEYLRTLDDYKDLQFIP